MEGKIIKFQNKVLKKGFNLFACGDPGKLPPKFKGAMILGNGGKSFWNFFSKNHDGPIDDFVTNYIEATLLESGLKKDDFQRFYPHPDHTPPLLQMSRHFNLSKPSKLGLDINSKFGPWFGLRALFLFKKALPEIAPEPFPSPCDQCSLRPCLKSCPGNVFKNGTFSQESCKGFRLKENTPCENKCDARLACPIGKEHQYSTEQMSYHYKHSLKMLRESRDI